MNLARVDQIVNAVLYEGYMLYPYRPSSVKNRQRWTFGGVYPEAYSRAQNGSEAWTVQTECLAPSADHSGSGQSMKVDVKIRFLHLLLREVGELEAPMDEFVDGMDPTFRVVPSLQIGERRFQTWQEAVEREVGAADLELHALVERPRQFPFDFPAQRKLEPLRGPTGDIVGVLVRRQQAIAGAVEVEAEPVGEGCFKIRVRVMNLTPWKELDRLASGPARDDALLSAFVSTHMILGVRGGEFISLLDPPERWREAAAACHNVGTWPVLVGEPGERDMLLSSPIILYDYPEVAPESPGDLFDGTEIDEILTLRIMTLTDEEKREMVAVDERARALLARTEALSGEQLLQLHGAMRSLRPLGEV